MNASPQKKVAYTITGICIIGPLLLMFRDLNTGMIFLFLGLIISFRALRFSGRPDPGPISDADLRRNSRHHSNRGRTILVQVVDDFGRELPPATVQKLLAEANAKAGPRDSIMAVHYKIDKELE